MLALALALALCIHCAAFMSEVGADLDDPQVQRELGICMSACRAALDADDPRTLQLYQCALSSAKRGAGVDCRGFVYGKRRLPLEPMTP